jgi:hypothetical protein
MYNWKGEKAEAQKNSPTDRAQLTAQALAASPTLKTKVAMLRMDGA